MKTNKIIIISVIVIIFIYFVINSMKGSITISGHDAKKIIQEGGILLDVRTPEEFKKEAIEGAINIPVQILQENLSKIPDHNRPIVVYCRSGQRSAKAKEILDQAGYKNTYNLGSMDNWYQTEY